MTNGQIAQLQELSKCYMATEKDWFLLHLFEYRAEHHAERKLYTPWKKELRRLTHQYRNQIAAMKKNRL